MMTRIIHLTYAARLWHVVSLYLVVCVFATTTFRAAAAPNKKYNVLYLLSDDMRADLGSYGLPVHTPNLDRLASTSLRFEHAYCQISVCAPSRMSFMTSLRPDRNKVWNFIDENPNTTQAIPGHFRNAGYLTLGLGKTFHQERGAWNVEQYFNTTGPYGKPYFQYAGNKCTVGNEGGGQCAVPDDQIWDYQLRLQILEYLKHAANYHHSTRQPFFLMSGFRDPHAPWAAPPRMYDLYDEDKIDIPTHKTLGDNTPLIAWSPELNVCLANGTSFPYKYDKPVPDWVLRNQRKAYYASVSYVDEHIGAILNVLEKEGLANNTIVVFHADHGYALGEHGYWEKKSNFDLTVRVPLIIHVPGITDAKDYVHETSALLDLVDIFPTLSSLAGLSLPPKGTIDGRDLSSVILGENQNGRQVAYHQYPACNTESFNDTRTECNHVEAKDFDFMGYSIRTARWRYTCWYHWNQQALEPYWDGDYAEELYDHAGDNSSDLDQWENANLALTHQKVARLLKYTLEAFFRDGKEDCFLEEEDMIPVNDS